MRTQKTLRHQDYSVAAVISTCDAQFGSITVSQRELFYHVAILTGTLGVIKGSNKQLVTQVAANIRSVRPIEPYKGKGIRYENEKFTLKEVKKK